MTNKYAVAVASRPYGSHAQVETKVVEVEAADEAEAFATARRIVEATGGQVMQDPSRAVLVDESWHAFDTKDPTAFAATRPDRLYTVKDKDRESARHQLLHTMGHMTIRDHIPAPERDTPHPGAHSHIRDNDFHRPPHIMKKIHAMQKRKDAEAAATEAKKHDGAAAHLFSVKRGDHWESAPRHEIHAVINARTLSHATRHIEQTLGKGHLVRHGLGGRGDPVITKIHDAAADEAGAPGAARRVVEATGGQVMQDPSRAVLIENFGQALLFSKGQRLGRFGYKHDNDGNEFHHIQVRNDRLARDYSVQAADRPSAVAKALKHAGKTYGGKFKEMTGGSKNRKPSREPHQINKFYVTAIHEE